MKSATTFWTLITGKSFSTSRKALISFNPLTAVCVEIPSNALLRIANALFKSTLILFIESESLTISWLSRTPNCPNWVITFLKLDRNLSILIVSNELTKSTKSLISFIALFAPSRVIPSKAWFKIAKTLFNSNPILLINEDNFCISSFSKEPKVPKFVIILRKLYITLATS